MNSFGLTFSLIFFLIIGAKAQQQLVKVALFSHQNIKNLAIEPVDGKYQIIADNHKPIKVKKNHKLYFTLVGDSISLWEQTDHLGYCKNLYLMGLGRNNSCKIEPTNPILDSRMYEGDFYISTCGEKISIVNDVSIDSYLAGVVEAESGPNAPYEFYKSQAIISRTYLLELISRQGKNNYQLNDDVNHQVYKGMSLKNPLIKQAVLHTSGLVIADTANQLITATFHSNSGGQTLNSEDVWLSSKSYLKGADDPYSLNQRNTFWTDTLLVNDWLNYLKNNGFNIDSENAKIDNLYYEQPLRAKYYVYENDTLSLRKIREDLKLRSTWFSFKPEGNYLIFIGRGYGHGVGLSQEGAMQMARENFSFLDIIHFYYKQVKVVHFSQTTDKLNSKS
jgi:stage II sporulation protein D